MPNTFRLFLGFVSDQVKSGQFLAWLGDEAQSPVPAIPMPDPALPSPSPSSGPVPVPSPSPIVPYPAPVPAPKKFTVKATIFDRTGENLQVAYSDVPSDWPSRMIVSLPFHFVGKRPRVHIWEPRDCLTDIGDVGPWNTNDPYWLGSGHPQAETGIDMRGRNTNLAGIDLSPALAKFLGISAVVGSGQVTWSFEDALPAPSAEPAWLMLGRAEIGFHETGTNQGIQKYVDLAGYGTEGDPWCSIWAGAMLHKAGVPLTGVNAMARSFATSPDFVKIDTPQLGCIVVFWRGTKDGSEGHVGFWISEDATYIQTLGGNETDQVEIAPMPKNGATFGLLGYYWPKT